MLNEPEAGLLFRNDCENVDLRRGEVIEDADIADAEPVPGAGKPAKSFDAAAAEPVGPVTKMKLDGVADFDSGSCRQEEVDISRTDWARVTALSDSEIDTSDVPSLDDGSFERAAVRMPKSIPGRSDAPYRPAPPELVSEPEYGVRATHQRGASNLRPGSCFIWSLAGKGNLTSSGFSRPPLPRRLRGPRGGVFDRSDQPHSGKPSVPRSFPGGRVGCSPPGRASLELASCGRPSTPRQDSAAGVVAMILHVTSVAVTGPTHLTLTFNDGARKRVDLGPLLYGPVFEPLHDIAFFAKARLDPELGTVVWPNETDFAPEALHALADTREVA